MISLSRLNLGLLIAPALLAMVLSVGCKHHDDNPVGPDTTRRTDTTKHDTIPSEILLLDHTMDTMNGCIAISGDGNRVACTAFGKLIFVFNANTGAVISKITGVFADELQFNYDGTKLLTNGNGDIAVYNATDASLIYHFPGYNGALLSSTGDSVLLVVLDQTGTMTSFGFYSSSTGAKFNTYAAPSDAAPMDVTKDGKYLVMLSVNERKMWLMDARTGQQASSYDQTTDIYGSEFSPDGGLLGGFARDNSNAFKLYNTTTGQQLATPYTVAPNDNFALFPDHKRIAVSHFSGTGTTADNSIFDLSSGAVVGTLNGIDSPYPWVRQFAMSDDGTRLAGSFWNSVKVWHVQ